MSQSRVDPVAISQELLELSDKSLMTGDFDLFCRCFALPQKMETFDSERWIETVDDLSQVFTDIRRYLSRSGVTQMVRHCIEASYKDDETIVATDEARLLRGNELVQQPYPAFSVLRCNQGQWQVAGCVYAISDAPEFSRALAGPEMTAVHESPAQIKAPTS